MLCACCGRELENNDNDVKFCAFCENNLDSSDEPNSLVVYEKTAEPSSHSVAPNISGIDEAIKVCFTKFATFEGRASRSEFWFFQLFIVFWVGAFLIAVSLSSPKEERLSSGAQEKSLSSSSEGERFSLGAEKESLSFNTGFERLLREQREREIKRILKTVAWCFALVVALPPLAVTVRRLHDANRSGWWALFMVVCLISLAFPDGFVYFICLFTAFTPAGLFKFVWFGWFVKGVVVSCLYVCLIGNVVVPILCALPSYPKANKYGLPAEQTRMDNN